MMGQLVTGLAFALGAWLGWFLGRWAGDARAMLRRFRWQCVARYAGYAGPFRVVAEREGDVGGPHIVLAQGETLEVWVAPATEPPGVEEVVETPLGFRRHVW